MMALIAAAAPSDGLEHDVAGEAVGDHDVDVAGEDVAPLDVADELEVLLDVGRQAACRPRASARSP